MSEGKIKGVKIIPLKKFVDDRGYLMEILRCDDQHFIKFGQVYLSTCYPGIVKAWHSHKIQTDNFCVIKGNAKIGLYDGREDSPSYKQTEYYVIGEQNPLLVQIPPMVWHGQMAIGPEMSFLINIPTEPYNRYHPDEIRKDASASEINFDWLPKSC